MSTEEAVTDALQQPMAQNAEAAEDAKKMLAELEAANATNGAVAAQPAEKQNTVEKEGENADVEDPAKPVKTTTEESKKQSPERRFHDRSDRRGDRGGHRGRGRGRGDHSARNFRANIKSDVTTQEETDDPVAIRKQVEFYFSDSNLPKDQFLFNKVGGSKNNPVELKVLHSFKRMRHFQPFEAIVNALKDSTVLELADDDTCVRRKQPLPEDLDESGSAEAVKIFEDRAMPRSIYAKGFGEEVPSTQFDIEAFFTPYGPTNAVRLRRTDAKVFKGSVFVEFENEELAQAFLAVDPKPQYKGKDLQIMSKKEYCEKKVDDIKSGRIRPNKNFDHKTRGGGDRRGGGRDFKRKRDGEDNRDWRERRDEDRKGGFRHDKDRSRNHRDSRGSKRDNVEKDDRGIPVVKTNIEDESKSSRDAARVDALAKAKAVVEAENKKEAEEKQNPAGDTSTTTEAPASNKRAREDDEGDAEREVKKVDSKIEVEAVNGS